MHLLNYTNPNADHGWLESTYAVGPQTVSMRLPNGVKVKSMELLRAESGLDFHFEGDVLRFTVPRVDDYEVAAISVA